MRCTSGWRTTSCASKNVKATPSTARSTSTTCASPDCLPARQVGLRDVAGDHRLGAEADARQEHLHLLEGGVLRLIEDDEGVVERAAAHEGERRDLDHVALDEARHAVEAHHLVERVVHRPQVRIDLLRQVSRQEPEALARLDRRTHQDEPPHALGLQRLDRAGHREVGLAGAGGADAEGEIACCGCGRGSRAGGRRARGCRRSARARRARARRSCGGGPDSRSRSARCTRSGVISSCCVSANSSRSRSSALTACAPLTRNVSPRR